jgi:hypothetical protein
VSADYPFTFHVCGGCHRRVSQTNECPGIWERCPDNPEPVVLDLDDRYFDGQSLPEALRDYTHVHSTTGVCVKAPNGAFCRTPPAQSGPEGGER